MEKNEIRVTTEKSLQPRIASLKSIGFKVEEAFELKVREYEQQLHSDWLKNDVRPF